MFSQPKWLWLVVSLGAPACLGPSSTSTIVVSVNTTGADFDDDGYYVEVGGPKGIRTPAGVNGVLYFSVEAGRHRVELVGVAENCVATPDRQEVEVPDGGTVGVEIEVRCTATGFRVVVEPGGADIDPRYRIEVDGRDAGTFAIPESLSVTRLVAGSYQLHLTDVAPNCRVAGPNPRSVSVGRQQVAAVAFGVICARHWGLAFRRGGQIAVAAVDGSDIDVVGRGEVPQWSPDGSRLAYDCDGSVCLLDFDSGRTTRLLVDENERLAHPAWHPDGRLTVARYGTCDYYDPRDCVLKGLFFVGLSNNSTATLIASFDSLSSAADLEWSPNGSRLAFSCASPTRTGICQVAGDGRDFRFLREGNVGAPAWKPDGSLLALHGAVLNGPVEILTMNPNGGQLAALKPGSFGRYPDWKPDGALLVLESIDGLFVMRPDGSGLTRLTSGPDGEPAWRP